MGANIFRDYFAKIRDIVGGRSAAYEKAMNQARRLAFNDLMETAASLGANAVIGIDLNCGVIDKRGSMFVGIDHWHRDQRRRRTRPQRIPATVNGRFPAPSTTLQADTPSRASSQTPPTRHRAGGASPPPEGLHEVEDDADRQTTRPCGAPSRTLPTTGQTTTGPAERLTHERRLQAVAPNSALSRSEYPQSSTLPLDTPSSTPFETVRKNHSSAARAHRDVHHHDPHRVY